MPTLLYNIPMNNQSPETILGRFRLEARLGDETYRAFDLRSSAPVSLKLLPAALSRDANLMRRFQRETSALQNLAHPNLAPLVGFYQSPDRAALVSQWVEGSSLAEILQTQRGQPLPPADVLAYMNILSSILGYAHNAGVIHANLKPSNILVNRQGTIFLSDFNLLPPAMLPPSPFRPPEAAAGLPLRPSADVFSLGALLYTLVTGQIPPAARIPDPRRANPTLSPGMARLVQWATDPQPEQRPQSARDFFNAICQSTGTDPAQAPDHALTLPGLPEWLETPDMAATAGHIHAPAPTAAFAPAQSSSPLSPTANLQFSSAAPSSNLKWLLVFFGGAALIALLALISLGGMASTPALAGPSPTPFILITPTATLPASPTPQASATAAPALPTPTQAIELSATPAPTHSAPPFIAYAKGSVGNSDLYLAEQDGANPRLFVAQSGCDESEPALSPDESYLVFQRKCSGGSYDIWKVAVDNGSPIQLTNDPANDEREPTWGPDGSIIYRVNPTGRSADQDGELWIINNDGSDPRTLAIQGRGPAISPDGRLLAFMSKRGGLWQIYVYTFASGKTVQITSGNNCRWPAWAPDSQQVAYNLADEGNNALGVYIVPAGGGDAHLVTEDGAGRPNWSSNGLIAFNSSRGIEVVRADGSNRRVLIGEVQAWSPAWSR